MVLSEPVGRLEVRRTYGSVPHRQRPALGRRDRPEQDFSSGLRRRDDRRAGTAHPCSAALYGRVLKAATNNDAIESCSGREIDHLILTEDAMLRLLFTFVHVSAAMGVFG